MGEGVNRVLLLHDGSAAHGDLFQTVLTLLDPQVKLGLLPIAGPGGDGQMGARRNRLTSWAGRSRS